ncbi:MAG: hypothetical protein ACI9FD_003567, partial [Gammaproteobacteria bacterium]
EYFHCRSPLYSKQASIAGHNCQVITGFYAMVIVLPTRMGAHPN